MLLIILPNRFLIANGEHFVVHITGGGYPAMCLQSLELSGVEGGVAGIGSAIVVDAFENKHSK